MIHSSHALVTLKPARQAALQAILTVEAYLRRRARRPALPPARTFRLVLRGRRRRPP
ncbi:plasmid SOS inhibition protein A, partial [Salmonella enterica]|uniref:plasmid SOS inhibition protein A n=1 Tax=Salmonella enterica TaxID=28901 RepID=UPI00125B4B34